MKAIILAAGYATRLYPLTINKSKALLPIGDKPIIEHICDKLSEIDEISHIYVITNHRFYDDFLTWADSAKNPKISVLDDGTTNDENKLGAIGDINYVINEKNIDEDLFIIAGDSFFTFDLKDFYNFYKSCNADCSLAMEIDDIDSLKRFAVASTDEKGKITKLVEKPENPESNLAVYAFYIYTKETVKLFRNYLEKGNKADAPGFFLQWLHKEKDVYLLKAQGECYDIGTPESYQEVLHKYS